MAQGDPAKWQMPGWRIEQRYANGVLIGNWHDERLKFQKGNVKHDSIYRVDFKDVGAFRPDVTQRRKGEIQHNDGIGREYLFRHHGNRYSNNMISWYDEHYNRRTRDEPDRLPALRHWDKQRLTWAPEINDYPIQGAGTMFGLKDKLHQRWNTLKAIGASNDEYSTTHRSSYTELPSDALTKTRHGILKPLSTTLNKINLTNKNLELRGKTTLLLPDLKP